MSVPLRITFRNLAHSDAIEARVREKAQKLERFAGLLTDAHVVLDAPHRHHTKGRIYTVLLELHVVGRELAVHQDSGANHEHEDIYVALRDAFAAGIRQLDDHVSKKRTSERVSS